jgi:branched-chain amino acid transport system substrate-binding protein
MRVAFFQDLSLEDSVELVSPSFLALELAVQEEGVGLPTRPAVVQFDTHGDAAVALTLAREIVADPTYVVVVVAPFWSPPSQVQALFAARGVPVISLSAADPPPSSGVWRRLVTSETAQASGLASALDARTLAGDEPCLADDGSVRAVALRAKVAAFLMGPAVPFTAAAGDAGELSAAISKIRTAGCRTVGWTGFPDGARALRDGLTAAGLRGVTMVGSDAMKVRSYLGRAAGADGTLVTCPCADLTTSADPAAQRMVHDYQAATGREPGVYAAEGWDVGGILLGVIRRGARTRGEVRVAVAAITDASGVAGPYRFTAVGSIASVAPRLYRAQGLRWIAVPPNG